MSTIEKIIEETDKIAPRIIEFRRDFHKHPEPRFTEMRTASLIARELTNLGYEVLIGKEVCLPEARVSVPSKEGLEEAYQWATEHGADPEFVGATKEGLTGVIGILRCGEGPTVAMRFDIDALNILETTSPEHFPAKEGFASVHHGRMHACGHDAHAASGLGVAHVLMQIKDQLHGTVKLIFQPGEEGGQGAKSIVEMGHLDDVDFLFGAHNGPISKYDVLPGITGGLSVNKYDVVFHGQSTHGGLTPHLGANALLAAATAVQNLYAISRHADGISRVNVGNFYTKNDRNVIADTAYMQIDLRGGSADISEHMESYALRILENAAAMHGCTVTYTPAGCYPPVTCDEAFAERIGRVCRDQLGLTLPKTMTLNLTCSEDVSFMIDRVRARGGLASFMGIHVPRTGSGHSPTFDLGEEYLTKCVKVFTALTYDILK